MNNTTKFLIMSTILIVLSINSKALFNPSCIVNTLCDIPMTYKNDTGSISIDATCIFTVYSPDTTLFLNNTYITNSSTMDYHYPFTPTMVGTYHASTRCTNPDNKDVQGSYLIQVTVPDNESLLSNITTSLYNLSYTEYLELEQMINQTEALNGINQSLSNISNTLSVTLSNMSDTQYLIYQNQLNQTKFMENQTNSLYVIAGEQQNQTGIMYSMLNVFNSWANWMGIPLYGEVNIDASTTGLPYIGSNLYFNADIRDELWRIISNANCTLYTNQTSSTQLIYNNVTKKWQGGVIPAIEGYMYWEINCSNPRANNVTVYGSTSGTIPITDLPLPSNTTITAFTCTGGTESNLNVFVSEWLPTGSNQKLYAYYTSSLLNNTAIYTLDTMLQLWMNNQSYNMTYDSATKSWQILLESNVNESVNITIMAYDPSYTCQNDSRTINFASFTDACISIWEDRNMTHRYENKFGYVLANLQPKTALGQKFNKDASMIMTQKVLYPVAIFSTWGDKTFGLNYTRAYSYYRKSFHVPYINGMACVSVPQGQVFNYVFVSGEWMFSDVIYDIPMWTKQDTAFNLGTAYEIDYPTTYNFVASPYEQDPSGYIWGWILVILFTLLIILIPLLAYLITQDAYIAARLLIVLLVSLPALYYVIKWIFL